MLIGVINFGVSLFFGKQEADFFEALKFALNVARIFFDQFSKTTYVGLEIWILRIDNDDLAAHT